MNATMSPEKTAWAEEIFNLRKRHGMLQRDAAKLLRVPLGTYRNWEQGKAIPNEFTRDEVSRILRRGKR